MEPLSEYDFYERVSNRNFVTGSEDTFSVQAFRKSFEVGFHIIDLKTCPRLPRSGCWHQVYMTL